MIIRLMLPSGPLATFGPFGAFGAFGDFDPGPLFFHRHRHGLLDADRHRASGR
jgi:hypothetical protein